MSADVTAADVTAADVAADDVAAVPAGRCEPEGRPREASLGQPFGSTMIVTSGAMPE
jgi:hypothetical protein